MLPIKRFKLTDEKWDLLQERTKFPWTRESFEEVVNLYQPGVSLLDLSEATGIAKNTLSRAFKLAGVPVKHKGGWARVFTDADELFFLRCNQKGLSVSELARLTGVRRQTMTRALERARIRKSHVQSSKPAR